RWIGFVPVLSGVHASSITNLLSLFVESVRRLIGLMPFVAHPVHRSYVHHPESNAERALAHPQPDALVCALNLRLFRRSPVSSPGGRPHPAFLQPESPRTSSRRHQCGRGWTSAGGKSLARAAKPWPPAAIHTLFRRCPKACARDA